MLLECTGRSSEDKKIAGLSRSSSQQTPLFFAAGVALRTFSEYRVRRRRRQAYRSDSAVVPASHDPNERVLLLSLAQHEQLAADREIARDAHLHVRDAAIVHVNAAGL